MLSSAWASTIVRTQLRSIVGMRSYFIAVAMRCCVPFCHTSIKYEVNKNLKTGGQTNSFILKKSNTNELIYNIRKNRFNLKKYHQLEVLYEWKSFFNISFWMTCIHFQTLAIKTFFKSNIFVRKRNKFAKALIRKLCIQTVFSILW